MYWFVRFGWLYVIVRCVRKCSVLVLLISGFMWCCVFVMVLLSRLLVCSVFNFVMK